MVAAVSNTHYFGFHYRLLCFLGMGKFHYSEDNNFNNYPPVYSIYALLCILIIHGYTVAEGVYAYKEWGGEKDKTEQFLALSLCGIHGFQCMKTLILIKNNKKIQKVVRVLEIDTKKFNGDEEILKKSKKITKFLSYGFVFMGSTTMIFMALYSLIKDIKRSQLLKASNYTIYIRRDTPFTAYVPWETEETLGYSLGFIYCTVGIMWVAFTLMISDTLVASVMVHISGQFEMVQKCVEETGDRALDILERRLDHDTLKRADDKLEIVRKAGGIDDWDERDNFTLRRKRLLCYFNEEDFNLAMICCFKEAIQYHQLIIEITQDLQEAYCQAFLCQILASFYVIGLILVQTALDISNVKSLRFVNTLFYLMSILWQLFIQTYTANEITSEAEKVATCAYACRWYSSDRRVGLLLVILLQKAQRPMVLTAGYFSAMSNRLFLSVIKSAYQIFTLVSTVMNTDK